MCMPVGVPLARQPRGLEMFLWNIGDLYVMMTRMQCNLIIICSIEYGIH